MKASKLNSLIVIASMMVITSTFTPATFDNMDHSTIDYQHFACSLDLSKCTAVMNNIIFVFNIGSSGY